MYELRNFGDGMQLMEYLNELPSDAQIITTHYHDFNWHVLVKRPTERIVQRHEDIVFPDPEVTLPTPELPKKRGGRPRGSKNKPRVTNE